MTGEWPASSRRFTVCDPIYPAPPATRTFMSLLQDGTTNFGVYANSRFIHNAIVNLPIFEEVMTQFPEGGACQDRLNRRYFGVYEYRQFPHRPWKPQTTVAESFKDRAQRRPAAST